jgi:hypothetical protein
MSTEPRRIQGHEITPVGEVIDIFAIGDPEAGGANSVYRIENWHEYNVDSTTIRFHTGGFIEGECPTGVTEACLLAIVADRLRSFQSGPFSCRENALALTKVEEALHWIHHRTLDRTRRGVEGRNEK